MATGADANILVALLDHLATLTFTPSLAVAYPGVPFPAPGEEKPDNYLEVTYLPNVTRTVTIAGGTQQLRGLLQISVYWKAGEGMVKPLDAATMIVDHFAKDTALYSGGVKVRIDRKPYASTPLQEDDRVQIPVTVSWHCFA